MHPFLQQILNKNNVEHPQDLWNLAFVHATPLCSVITAFYDRHGFNDKSSWVCYRHWETSKKGCLCSSIAYLTAFCSSDVILHLNLVRAWRLEINLLLRAEPFVQGILKLGDDRTGIQRIMHEHFEQVRYRQVLSWQSRLQPRMPVKSCAQQTAVHDVIAGWAPMVVLHFIVEHDMTEQIVFSPWWNENMASCWIIDIN